MLGLEDSVWGDLTHCLPAPSTPSTALQPRPQLRSLILSVPAPTSQLTTLLIMSLGTLVPLSTLVLRVEASDRKGKWRKVCLRFCPCFPVTSVGGAAAPVLPRINRPCTVSQPAIASPGLLPPRARFIPFSGTRRACWGCVCVGGNHQQNRQETSREGLPEGLAL